MSNLKTVLLTCVVLAVLAVAWLFSGVFDIAADSPHWPVTSWSAQTLRDQSIARRAKDHSAPATLEQPAVIAKGAGEYAEMCAGCHLAPGMADTELRQGLNPAPPALAALAGQRAPAEQFWIIKHGLKMTGMPAWGPTHDDERLWSIVAFLRRLPGMTAEDYRQLVSQGGHTHDHGEAEHHAASPAPALSGEAADAEAVVDRFSTALAQGRTQEAAALLETDVLILESGGAEKSREEYASHHLQADAEFLATATVKRLSRTGKVSGDFAWIATEAQITTRGEKPADILSTETMLLRRTPQGWRIAHIHWSSHRKG
jgi:mono/diheme cytochrome c family protein/ketosteroid isomerase-like protein